MSNWDASYISDLNLEDQVKDLKRQLAAKEDVNVFLKQQLS